METKLRIYINLCKKYSRDEIQNILASVVANSFDTMSKEYYVSKEEYDAIHALINMFPPNLNAMTELMAIKDKYETLIGGKRQKKKLKSKTSTSLMSIATGSTNRLLAIGLKKSFNSALRPILKKIKNEDTRKEIEKSAQNLLADITHALLKD